MGLPTTTTMYRKVNSTSVPSLLPNLPIDVWAQIAAHLTQTDRIATFYRLRRAMVLPTYGTVHETMLRFLEVGAEHDRAHEIPSTWPELPTWSVDVEVTLLNMGFSETETHRALVASGGDMYGALQMLMI